MENTFKGIRASYNNEIGEPIISGQIVEVYGRLAPRETHEIYFEPNHGFRVQGNNLSDAIITKVVKDVRLKDRIIGNLQFLKFSILGK